MREDMSDAGSCSDACRGFSARSRTGELIFDLITCPVDTRNDELVRYWADCARAILRGRKIPYPPFGTKTLLDCELQYKAYDIRHQLLRRIGRPDDCSAQRRAICERIAGAHAREQGGVHPPLPGAVRSCRSAPSTISASTASRS